VTFAACTPADGSIGQFAVLLAPLLCPGNRRDEVNAVGRAQASDVVPSRASRERTIGAEGRQ